MAINSLNAFYNDEKKSIQKSYNFLVDIFDDKSDLVEIINKLQNYHVVSLNVPTWEFKKGSQPIGPFPKTFPLLDMEEGFEFTIQFEEDDVGTISQFIDLLQKRIINERGLYNYPANNRITAIKVKIVNSMANGSSQNDQENVVATYEFIKCYYLKSTPLALDYSTNEAMKIEITFACDNMKYTVDPKEHKIIQQKVIVTNKVKK